MGVHIRYLDGFVSEPASSMCGGFFGIFFYFWTQICPLEGKKKEKEGDRQELTNVRVQ